MYLVYLSVRFMAHNIFGSPKHSGLYVVVLQLTRTMNLAISFYSSALRNVLCQFF